MTDTIGGRIRELRKSKKLTQRQLAERADIDFTYLSKIENDLPEYRPSERVIRALAKALGADADGLVLLAQKMPKPMQESLARNTAAHAFLRTATASGLTDADWQTLLAEVEKLRKSRRAK